MKFNCRSKRKIKKIMRQIATVITSHGGWAVEIIIEAVISPEMYLQHKS